MPPSRRRRAPSGARESQSPPASGPSKGPSGVEAPRSVDGSDAAPDHYTYQEMVDHLRKVRSSSNDQGLKSKKKRRRRSNQPIRAKRRRRLMVVGIGLVILLPILAFIGGSFLFSYFAYGGEKFRKEMSESVSETIGFRGEFEDPFAVSKLSVKNRKFNAVGPDDSVLTSLILTNTAARLQFGSFFSDEWNISQLIADRAELQLRPVPPGVEETALAPVQEAIRILAAGIGFSGVPEDYIAESISCRSFDAIFGANPDQPHRLEGVRLNMTRSDDGYFIEAAGGALNYFYWPEFTIESADLMWHYDGRLLVNRAHLLTENGGICTITGEVNLGSDPSIDLSIEVENIKVSDMVTKSWDERVLGRLSGSFRLKGGLRMGDLPVLQGKLTIPGLSVKNLSVLEILFLNFNTAELKRIEFDEFSASFEQDGTRLRFFDIYGKRSSLAGLLGEFTVESNHNIRGKFEIGLPNSTLDKASKNGIKKGRPSFFKPKPGDPYGWTSFDVAGNLEVPTDNLLRQFEAHYRGEYNPRELRSATTFQRPQSLRSGPNDIYLERLNQLFNNFVPPSRL